MTPLQVGSVTHSRETKSPKGVVWRAEVWQFATHIRRGICDLWSEKKPRTGHYVAKQCDTKSPIDMLKLKGAAQPHMLLWVSYPDVGAEATVSTLRSSGDN